MIGSDGLREIIDAEQVMTLSGFGKSMCTCQTVSTIRHVMTQILDEHVARQLVDLVMQLDHEDAEQAKQRFLPWQLHGQRYGWIQQAYLAAHADLAAFFTLRSSGGLTQLEMMPDALVSGELSRCLYRLFKQGVFIEWRDEAFPVRPVSDDFTAEPVQGLALERGCFRMLGLTSRAVHVNVWCGPTNHRRLWVARRSQRKQVDPGKLDNTIAGGIAAGETVAAALCREAWEEAGVSMLPDQAGHMLPVLSMRLLPEGLHREWLFIKDLTVEETFRPQNQDGEVAEFSLLAVDEIAERILARQFTRDAALTVVCSLSAQGALGEHKARFEHWLAHREMHTLFGEA